MGGTTDSLWREEVTQIIILYSCGAPWLNKGVWLLFWAFQWPLELARGKASHSPLQIIEQGQRRNRLSNPACHSRAMLFSLPQADAMPACLHPSIHSSICMYILPIPIYSVILKKKGKESLVWAGATPTCLGTVLQEESFLANNTISLGIWSPALLLVLLRLLAPPSFPCWLPLCQQDAPSANHYGNTSHLSGLLLIQQIGKTPDLSRGTNTSMMELNPGGTIR